MIVVCRMLINIIDYWFLMIDDDVCC